MISFFSDSFLIDCVTIKALPHISLKVLIEVEPKATGKIRDTIRNELKMSKDLKDD